MSESPMFLEIAESEDVDVDAEDEADDEDEADEEEEETDEADEESETDSDESDEIQSDEEAEIEAMFLHIADHAETFLETATSVGGEAEGEDEVEDAINAEAEADESELSDSTENIENFEDAEEEIADSDPYSFSERSSVLVSAPADAVTSTSETEAQIDAAAAETHDQMASEQLADVVAEAEGAEGEVSEEMVINDEGQGDWQKTL